MEPITFTFPGFRKIFSKGCNLFEKAAPLSIDCVIAFPYTSDKKFSRTIYSSEMTQGKATSEDINQALTLFEVCYSRLPSIFSLFTSIALRYFLPAFILLYTYCDLIFYSYYNNYWIFFAIYCVGGIYYQVYDRKKQLKNAKAELEDIMKVIQPGYLKRGLRWRVPDNSYGWIELIKQYRIDVNGAQESEKSRSEYVPPHQNVDENVEIILS